MSRRRLTVLAGGLSAAAAATALCIAPATAATSAAGGPEPSTGPLASDSGASVAEMSAQWLAKEHGLSIETARERVASQEDKSRKAEALERSLGARAVGSFIDQTGGVLVVNVTDADAAARVQKAGATARIVTEDKAELGASQAKAVKALGTTVIDSSVDPVTNKVVITVPSADVASARTRTSDPSVTIQGTDATVSTQANVYGGQQIEFSGYVCSLGFNATKSGSPVFITAGHCAEGNQTFTRNGTTLGTTRGWSFPGNDYAYSSLTSSWTGIGAVDLYNGTSARSVTGSSNAAVGTAICKSGRTTGWTCGSVQTKNVTVNYNNGDGTYSTVSGLTKSNTCTEGGDSGGSWMAGNLAQGVTSGGAGYGANAVCGQKVGQPNIAYFQPIGEILSVYGLTLKTA